MSETTLKQVDFACPKCKQSLRFADNALYCSECNRAYPILGGIPDFLETPTFTPSVSRIAKLMDLVAPIYETRFFVSLLAGLSGIRDGSQLMNHIASFHTESLKGVMGSILDVACGPASYGRRIAGADRSVYGVDISMGVLRQGMTYIKRTGIPGVYLARARVEELPFKDAVFDGVICSGSLHLFPDTVASLREMARTMKPGAPLSVQTFVAGKTVINRIVQKRSWLHTFELAEMQRYLSDSGFEQFRPEMDGIVFTFTARKGRSVSKSAGASSQPQR